MFAGAFALGVAVSAAEFHVAINGTDSNAGASTAPFRTIQHAAEVAQPGNIITVHAGVYRERVNPPRGGTSEDKRITYQAAPGERVEIKGSEVAKGWAKVEGDVWKVMLPNSFFGKFNPYSDLIHGDWFNAKKREHHTGAVYLNGEWLVEAAKLEDVLAAGGGAPSVRPSEAKPTPAAAPLWFATVDATNTTIWAQFNGVNPNEQLVEINVRQTVFYPDQPGRDFITVRGFAMRHAATPWAPPTAEQIGLIGTHWSKGWIIESNTISHSICSGIALGKHGDKYDNTSANSAEGYVKTIERAHAFAISWTKEKIGHHIVRNNIISHCEQTGIVGSLGCSFSTVTGNVIHDIHIRQLFTGAEMGGIKFHGAIDTTISCNHIYRTIRGIWLDWMAQGTRVSGNLLHDNAKEDFFMEVNHGPLLVDNNIFLSRINASDMSEGGAFVHNLFAGKILTHAELHRDTPFHPPHSTAVAGLINVAGGDNRFYHNLFVTPCDLQVTDKSALPCIASGNVFTQGAKPSKFDANALIQTNFNPSLKLEQKADGWYLTLAGNPAWRDNVKRPLVTTALLGKAKIPGCAYENPDGSPLKIDSDYFSNKRNEKNPFPGPFESVLASKAIKVWPVGSTR